MRLRSLLSALIFVGNTALTSLGADLTKVDRTIAKEPTYKTKPKYGLVVFGPEAKTRVWLVLDGDVLYVDRNGNGDLTEAAERFKETNGFQIGELSLPDGSFPKNSSGLWVYRNTHKGAARDSLRLTVTINQKTWLGTFNKLADRPKDAPIIHFNFNGPLTFVCLDPPIFVPGKATKLTIHIGTPGLGEKTCVWRSHACSIVGGNVRLLAEIEYPNKDPGGKPFFATHVLPLED